jgi:hypothetical protein
VCIVSDIKIYTSAHIPRPTYLLIVLVRAQGKFEVRSATYMQIPDLVMKVDHECVQVFFSVPASTLAYGKRAFLLLTIEII